MKAFTFLRNISKKICIANRHHFLVYLCSDFEHCLEIVWHVGQFRLQGQYHCIGMCLHMSAILGISLSHNLCGITNNEQGQIHIIHFSKYFQFYEVPKNDGDNSNQVMNIHDMNIHDMNIHDMNIHDMNIHDMNIHDMNIHVQYTLELN